MSYACSVVEITDTPAPLSWHGREFIAATGKIPSGQEPVLVTVRAYADSKAAEFLSKGVPGGRILVAGEVALSEEPQQPIITAFACCTAHPDQYLNEVSLVGRLGSEPRVSEKSVKRSIAANRYYANPDGGDPIEETDWYGCRTFGNSQERFSKAEVGSLMEVAGSFSQMKNGQGEPFVEVKVRSFRVHKGRSSSNPAAGTAAVGYDQASYENNNDLQAENW